VGELSLSLLVSEAPPLSEDCVAYEVGGGGGGCRNCRVRPRSLGTCGACLRAHVYRKCQYIGRQARRSRRLHSFPPIHHLACALAGWASVTYREAECVERTIIDAKKKKTIFTCMHVADVELIG
jgi:hypothetical protein